MSQSDPFFVHLKSAKEDKISVWSPKRISTCYLLLADALNESNEAPKSSDTKDEIMPGLEPNGVTNPEVVLETQTGDKTEEDTPKYVPARNTNETPETHVPANRSGMTIPPIAPSSQTGSEPKIQDETVQTLVKELQKVTSALAQFNKDTAKFLQLAADRSTQSIEMNNLILVLQENVGSFRPWKSLQACFDL